MKTCLREKNSVNAEISKAVSINICKKDILTVTDVHI